MLTEFYVKGGKALDAAKCTATLAEHGFVCELDPKFDLYAHEGVVRVRFQHGKTAAVAAGFDFNLGMPATDAPADAYKRLVGRYEQMLANLRKSTLPKSFVEAMESKLVELAKPKREQFVRIRVESKDSRPSDYAAAAMWAAACASTSGGTLEPYGLGTTHVGKDALAAMAKSKYLAMPGDDVPFTTWDAEKPKKKKPKKK